MAEPVHELTIRHSAYDLEDLQRDVLGSDNSDRKFDRVVVPRELFDRTVAALVFMASQPRTEIVKPIVELEEELADLRLHASNLELTVEDLEALALSLKQNFERQLDETRFSEQQIELLIGAVESLLAASGDPYPGTYIHPDLRPEKTEETPEVLAAKQLLKEIRTGKKTDVPTAEVDEFTDDYTDDYGYDEMYQDLENEADYFNEPGDEVFMNETELAAWHHDNEV